MNKPYRRPRTESDNEAASRDAEAMNAAENEGWAPSIRKEDQAVNRGPRQRTPASRRPE